MASFYPPNPALAEKSAAPRLLVGIPVLCAAMALCAWVAWARFGFPADLSPRHWWDIGLAPFLGMVFSGCVSIVLGAGALWVAVIVAGACGEVVITACRSLRRGNPADATYR